ncbi:MAG: hypothetical protein GY768_25740 [Planctomycetaceae bacterium]|nr:hypothetical protein [Planctomycetaceae bacterium]
MISNESFRRKIIYGALIAGLLIPLYLLSRPAMRESNGDLSDGGVLSQMRKEYNLSQANLGDIDPASETMKLATLGMKGIAANLLWERANRYKRDSDWDNLTATLNQISKLQPNFISVWQFQGWNLAYNVSVEFDDYRSRYHWVTRGIDFLRDGIRYNTDEPVLYWEIGWTFGHKIGKADEYVQYRRLFADDEDLHDRLRSDNIPMDNTLGPEGKPDNWLVGREWFRKAEQIVDRGIPIRGRLVGDNENIKRGKTPLIFHSHPPKWMISFAEAIEEEGYLDERARVAWMKAGDQWQAYGNRDIPTTYGFSIRLNEGPSMRQDANRIRDDLLAMIPGAKEEILNKKRDAMSPETLEAMELPWQERTVEQSAMALIADRRLRVEFDDLAKRAPSEPEKKAEFQRLIREGVRLEAEADAIDNYQEQVNYRYWKLRCEIEQSQTAIDARKYLYAAEEAYKVADLEGMRQNYEASWNEWAKIFEKYPVMLEDTTAEDLMESVARYRWVLEQFEETFPPADFKLMRLLELNDPNFNPNQIPQATDEASSESQPESTAINDGNATPDPETAEPETAEPETSS